MQFTLDSNVINYEIVNKQIILTKTDNNCTESDEELIEMIKYLTTESDTVKLYLN